MVTLQGWIRRQDLGPLRRQDYLLCLAGEQKATYSDVRDANGVKVTLGRISLFRYIFFNLRLMVTFSQSKSKSNGV